MKFVQWMGIGAVLNPKQGGRFRIDVDGEHFAAGRNMEVEAPHRLVMSWGWEGSDEVGPGSTTVEITLVPDRSGTLLRLRHSSLPNDEQKASHRDGWLRYLGRLADRLG